jgi:hypothetical protein
MNLALYACSNSDRVRQTSWLLLHAVVLLQYMYMCTPSIQLAVNTDLKPATSLCKESAKLLSTINPSLPCCSPRLGSLYDACPMRHSNLSEPMPRLLVTNDRTHRLTAAAPQQQHIHTVTLEQVLLQILMPCAPHTVSGGSQIVF